VAFGSLVRGEVTEESDIDVLVFSAGPVRGLDRAAGQMELGERVEPLVYSGEG
jgi:predicted nucleotidyltransferase